MNAIIDFMKGLRKLPVWVQLWLIVLGMSNMMAPLFYLNHREAQVVFIATMLGFGIGVIMYKAQGMTRLLGLMHTPWLVGVFFLWSSLSTTGTDELYGIWLRLALVLSIISLLLDGRDVVKYVMGERDSLV